MVEENTEEKADLREDEEVHLSGHVGLGVENVSEELAVVYVKEAFCGKFDFIFIMAEPDFGVVLLEGLPVMKCREIGLSIDESEAKVNIRVDRMELDDEEMLDPVYQKLPYY